MTKSFLFPDKDLECALRTPLNGLRRCFSSGSFAVFERCGFAAPFSCGGSASPGGAGGRAGPDLSSILHQVGNSKVELSAAQGAPGRPYCSLASNSNWRFRFREKKTFCSF